MLFFVPIVIIHLQIARKDLSCGQKSCSINFQATNGLLVLREGVTTLSNTIGEKITGRKNWSQNVEEEGGDGVKLKEKLTACQHFLVDTVMENGKHKVINFQKSNLDTKIIIAKLEEAFNKMDSVAKINIAIRFVLGNVETGKYRY